MFLRNKILLATLFLGVLGICALAKDMRAGRVAGKTLSEIEKEYADSSQPSKSIKTYPKITTTYGGVFKNVDVLRVDASSIFCRSTIGYSDIPLAHLPSDVLADLDHFISEAKEQAIQKAKEDQRKRIEAEKKRKEAEQLRIYNEEQSRKQREEQQEIQEANAARQIHGEEEKKAGASSNDPDKREAIRITPFIKHIIIIIIVGSIMAGLFGRKKHHKIP